MSVTNYVGFQVKNCIVTGEPAKVFTGHVVAQVYSQKDDCWKAVYRPLLVIAGFKDDETLKKAHEHNQGACFGDWKKEFGIEATYYGG